MNKILGQRLLHYFTIEKYYRVDVELFLFIMTVHFDIHIDCAGLSVDMD